LTEGCQVSILESMKFHMIDGRATEVLCISVLSLGIILGCAPKAKDASSGTDTLQVKSQVADGRLTAKVVFMEGEVTVDGLPVELGQDLGARFAIKTGAASSCDLVFGERNAVRIAQNTEGSVDLTQAILTVDLQKGGASSVLRKLEKVAGTDSFRIRTPGAVAGVRGTSFCVWADEVSSYICACNGEVRTIDAAGGNELDLRAAHHMAKLYTQGAGGYTVSDVGLLHHSDEGLESLAARIGETIDWTVPD